MRVYIAITEAISNKLNSSLKVQVDNYKASALYIVREDLRAFFVIKKPRERVREKVYRVHFFVAFLLALPLILILSFWLI